ncbi:uncharacterized protein LOC135832943 isoform X2 [Planococcus citri]|uniref:uncharacterized protein LOC135832943 isoform X2 n=1 Tax=Planococcus citri TaxID=170843 RepID=UPI0031F7C610
MSSFNWISASHGNVPYGAVVAGKDIDGALLYTGRTFHEGDTLPAKIAPRYRTAFVAFAGGEHSKTNYEVLCGTNIAWQYASNGQVPHNAILAGQTRNGEKLYIGRALHSGGLIPGKVCIS